MLGVCADGGGGQDGRLHHLLPSQLPGLDPHSDEQVQRHERVLPVGERRAGLGGESDSGAVRAHNCEGERPDDRF